MSLQHEPVMMNEVLEILSLKPGDVVVDGTLGLGGHAARMCDIISPEGTLLAFDRDPEMLEEAKQRLASKQSVKRSYYNQDFRTAAHELAAKSLYANGILLDLGYNSAQVDDPTRAFSFKHDVPLDMRYNPTEGEPASAKVNRMSQVQLETAIHELADEKWAGPISRNIVERRKTQPLRTTNDLVECVLAAIPPRAREKRIHPATRTFMAIRILTNEELDGLDDALFGLADRLADGGTLLVLSFHSGEDRIVKQAFRQLADNGFIDLTRKPLVPGSSEISRNSRSRSTKLRAIRKPVSAGNGIPARLGSAS